MRLLGNLIWFIFGGVILALGWLLAGIICCITIIGIPIGLRAFKLAGLALWPFGREVVYGGGSGRFILNIIWIILGGLILSLSHISCGLLFCITIVGIPFGLQHFKLAKLALMPFGASVVRS
ncbi:MAG: YccF domain-containing protein [Defluviitaleaceae bacterium]|nr:YccF domain-containing protein [Defluviitaleaceae bacterium]